MLKNFISLLVALALISSICVFGYEQPNYILGENMISNGGFELELDDWNSQNILFAQNDCVHSGSGAAIVKDRTHVQVQFYQEVSLEEGKIYLVSAWVRLENEEDNGAVIHINASDTTSISSEFSSAKATADDWQYIYSTVKVDSDVSSKISLANYTDASMNFYIDDISVCEIDTTNLEPTTIELFSSGAGVVPQNGVNTVKIRSNVYNQIGGQEGVKQTMDAYSIVGSPVGVSISDEGVLTIDSRTQEGTITVEGVIETKSGELSQTIEIEILPMISEKCSNLFANGSFENTDDLLFSGNFKILSNEAYEGNYSAYVSNGKIAQKVYLKPDKTYIVMAMVKSEAGDFNITSENGEVSAVNTRKSGEWKRIWATIDTAGIADKLLSDVSISSQSAYYADSLFVGELTQGLEDCEFSVSYIECENELKHLINGNVTPKVNLKNGSEDKTLRLICGLYSKNNPSKLLDAICVDKVEIGPFEEKDIEFNSTIEITDYKNQTLKLFAWDSELSPLGEQKETEAEDEVIYYVSPKGRHYSQFVANPSTVKFKNISSVLTQLYIRNLNEMPYPKDGITIILEDGVYEGSTTFSSIHSGTIDAPITIKATEGANVTLTGDRAINGPFEKADSSISERLIDAEARKHLVQIDLKEHGITDFDTVYTPGNFNVPWSLSEKEGLPIELVIDGKVMTLARYPNMGYMSVGAVVDKGTILNDINLDNSEEVSALTDEQKNKGFVISPTDTRYKSWKNSPQARMYGFFKYSFADQTIDIESIDEENNTLTVKYPSYYGINDEAYFYAFDILEEIDAPGEYYIDRSTGMLYLYPPEDVDLTEARVSITTEASPVLWFINDASNIVFENINIKNTRGNAVSTLNNNDNIKFVNCTFENTSDSAAVIGSESQNLVFDECYFAHINGGVVLSSGEPEKFIKGNSVVKNCLFEDFSRLTTTYRAAVTLNGIGNAVCHNTIRNAPQLAIQIDGGAEHLIEYNDIYNVLREADDMSVIYTGRKWTSRGIKIRYNYIHDISSAIEPRLGGIYGVYLDDLYSGMEITGNIFADFDGYGVFINGGRDNLVKLNIFTNTKGALYMSGIGMEVDKDISIFINGLNTVAGYENKDLWYQKFPELYNMENNEPRKPINNVFSENLLVNTGDNSLDFWAQNLLENESNLVKTYEEAGFDGSEGKEYLLLPNSEVFDFIKVFRQIPVNKMGAQLK